MLQFSKLFVFFILLIARFGRSFEFTTQYYGNARHPALPTHCYYEELDLAIPMNETVFPTDQQHFCVKVNCREDFVLVIKHCDRILLNRGCSTIPYDYSKPYPDCCYQVVCA